MSKGITKRWIEAGIAIAKDPQEKVKCPVCCTGVLLVSDIKKDEGSVEFERLMICQNCGAKNALRMRCNVI